MRISGIIYDCDGVLFDSQKANIAYYSAILARFDRPALDPGDDETAHLCHTAASPEVLRVLLGEDLVEEALTVAAALDYRQFIPQLRSEAGIEQALACLHRDYRLAVATNRGHSAPQLLAHFGFADYFTAVVTSRDVPRPKPYPDMLLLAAEKLGCRTDELIFVGDSPLDCEAARTAGIRFIGYKGTWEGVTAVAGHLELLDLLEGPGLREP